MVDSSHQIRVVVLPKSAANNAEVSKIVMGKLGAGWQVERLTPGSRLVLLTRTSEHTVGTPGHARESQRLRCTAVTSSAGLRRMCRCRLMSSQVSIPLGLSVTIRA